MPEPLKNRLRTVWQRTPLTTAILVLIALDCLASAFGHYVFPAARSDSLRDWWSFITYPLYGNPISLVLSGLWLYLAIADLERRWGSLRYGLFLAAAVPLSALPLLLGAAAFGSAITVAGPLLPLACLTVVWCLGRLDGVVLYGFLIPIPVKILLVLEFILVYLLTVLSTGQPFLSTLALAGPGLSCLYGAYLYPQDKYRAAAKRSLRKRAPQRRSRHRSRLRIVK